ncbi:hypothetical protein [Candidatus Contendibacter odensensis]|uniref:Uncharacterized protein n=1 Tax=Candidatus Contendobacter odensis Run_B_J11 TaxID=1400861 RepID=A0A7U7GEZ8_9GAMM|nr:hypothetical protein [Candidatus Contendobacter odensis]CDH46875.1 hypothetical protein BN874_630021 [Candidatus Contendobacter odensis Run_B_J11]
MLQAIEVEVSAQGEIIPQEPLPPGRRYRAVLTLLEPLEAASSPATEGLESLFGLLRADQGVSLEQMDLIVRQRARVKFHDCD